MTPPSPMARIIFIFRSMAGLGGGEDLGDGSPPGPEFLKIPMLFRRRERTASPFRGRLEGLLDLTVIIVPLSVVAILDVTLLVMY